MKRILVTSAASLIMALASTSGARRAPADPTVELLRAKERDGKRLTGGRPGRKLTPLRVEVHDVLVVTGQPRVRKIFQRDREGKITGFVDRREGEDLIWHREAKTGL